MKLENQYIHSTGTPTSRNTAQNQPSRTLAPQKAVLAKRDFDGWSLATSNNGAVIATNAQQGSAVTLIPPSGQTQGVHTYTMVGEAGRGAPIFRLTPYHIGLPVDGGALADGLDTLGFGELPSNATFTPKAALRFPYEGTLQNEDDAAFSLITYKIAAMTNVATLNGAALPIPTSEVAETQPSGSWYNQPATTAFSTTAPPGASVTPPTSFDGWSLATSNNGAVIATNAQQGSAVTLMPPSGQTQGVHTYTMVGEAGRGAPVFRLTPYHIGLPVDGGAIADGLDTLGFGELQSNATFTPKAALRFPFEGTLQNEDDAAFSLITYKIAAMTNVATLNGAALPIPTSEIAETQPSGSWYSVTPQTSTSAALPAVSSTQAAAAGATLGVGQIAGIAVGGAAALLILAGLGYGAYARHSKRAQTISPSEYRMDTFRNDHPELGLPNR